MRFKSFLKEEEISNFDDIVKRIGSECQQFLKESRALPLYRGFGKKMKPVVKLSGHFVPHPEDRKPLDSDAAFNFMFNAGADLAFGVRDIRKKTLFCTGDLELARHYGALNFVFPAGDIDYIWSRSITDSYENTNKIADDISLNLNKAMDSKAVIDFMDFFSERMSPHDFIDADEEDSDVKQGLEDAIDGTPPSLSDISSAIKKTFSEFYIENMNLDKAIKTGHEILIYKSEGCFLVPVMMAYEMLDDNSQDERYNLTPEYLRELYNKLINKIRFS